MRPPKEERKPEDGNGRGHPEKPPAGPAPSPQTPKEAAAGAPKPRRVRSEGARGPQAPPVPAPGPSNEDPMEVEPMKKRDSLKAQQ